MTSTRDLGWALRYADSTSHQQGPVVALPPGTQVAELIGAIASQAKPWDVILAGRHIVLAVLEAAEA